MFINALMFLAKIELKLSKRKHPNHTLITIKGTGKDYPNFLVYTESESWRNDLIRECERK